MCQISFQEWQLLPMGSYPRITDGRTPLQLYGPVQSFMCPSYNRAMTAFLSCTKVGLLDLVAAQTSSCTVTATEPPLLLLNALLRGV